LGTRKKEERRVRYEKANSTKAKRGRPPPGGRRGECKGGTRLSGGSQSSGKRKGIDWGHRKMRGKIKGGRLQTYHAAGSGGPLGWALSHLADGIVFERPWPEPTRMPRARADQRSAHAHTRAPRATPPALVGGGGVGCLGPGCTWGGISKGPWPVKAHLQPRG